ncbi:LysR family transcriptional regulator [Planotetraspora silvatica]|uniref:LysR family transcriptional regulator n=1 Tax=Planotetraspora silvatica TaxID=234614 RepID=A0A8J3UM77_9ACTN|nr:LysR family transcriptional regulator [Planotetraspora silvatica]GII46991.1 LysR family transcriptional regulator [Planotetraspora silvatica]
MAHADVDLRKLRYFVALAEELNFGRAAERLHIAQPVLSRQIQALEKELDAQLFVRDKRRTRLTPAGEQLVTEAELVLAGAEALRRRVAQAARAVDTLTVGFMPGLTVTGPVRALGEAHPGLTVEVLRTNWTDQVSVLHDGRVDVGYMRLPVDSAGLELRPLFGERRMAVLPADHRLAGETSVNITDLADERLLQHPDSVPEWGRVSRMSRGPRERGETPASETRSVEEKLEHVAAGRGFSILPESTAAYYQRPDVVCVPILDIPPNEVALAWVAARHHPLIGEFVELAVAMR